jgi:hypothetical protein
VTDGTAGTPLARKIGVKEGQRVALVHAPARWSIPTLPAGVTVRRRTDRPPFDVIVAFFRQLQVVGDVASGLTPDGGLWTAWPRRAAGHQSDITDNGIRSLVLPLGLVDVKVAALGDDWSGLKLVWRKETRSRLR